MKLFIVDAFTDHIFGGNQAGVALLRNDQPFPEDDWMQQVAAELKHSETAFVKQLAKDEYQLRYFTPKGEVALCGHATISAFTVLREQGLINDGDFAAQTLPGSLRVNVERDLIWLEMPLSEQIRTLTQEESSRVYAAYGLRETDRAEGMPPAIVNAGLCDIMLPVGSKVTLDQARQDREEVIRLTREWGLVGVHLFYCPPIGETAAFCRNFAPLYGIDEESATGTSNAALTYYLFMHKRIEPNRNNKFVQGEAMGKPSVILSRIDGNGSIWIGGNAVISVHGELSFE